MIFILSIIVVLAYLVGSIPSGYYLTKGILGINILEHGSGNIGSTNVSRVAGRKLSIITQIMDMLKGLVPVAIIQLFLNYEIIHAPNFYIYIVATSTIIGHDFSIFLKFKGGKGVNTTLGASLLLSPIPVLISVLVYYISKWGSKYVSISSIVLGLSLPITSYIMEGISNEFYYFTICSILIIVRHISNIQRFLMGTEPKTS